MRVEEIERDEDPILWVLLTSEPADEFESALTVIGYYRSRWTIEVSCRALKTGCRIEGRQLETWERMKVLRAICLVVAWKALQLRELARGEGQMSPEQFLTGAEKAILEQKHPGGPGRNGARDCSRESWGVSGSQFRPPPGWQTLWKGLKKVRTWAEGYKLHAENYG